MVIISASHLISPERGVRNTISCGIAFPIIPVFFEALSGSNKKYQELYDRIARLYDPAETLYRAPAKTQPEYAAAPPDASVQLRTGRRIRGSRRHNRAGSRVCGLRPE